MTTKTPHINTHHARRRTIAFAALALLVAAPGLLARAAAAADGSYGWPVKPFDRQHPVRGSFGDPRTLFKAPPTVEGVMTGSGSFSFHFGIDVSAPDGTPVYPVVSGTVTKVSVEWVRVSTGSRAFEYWHIRPAVKTGDRVEARKTVLGPILRGAAHVHLSELCGGRPVNPLQKGHLAPYLDTTQPRVASITVQDATSASTPMINFVRGPLAFVAEVYDTPAMPVPGIWNGMPITPALVTWRLQSWTGKVVLPERVVADFRVNIPANDSFWTVYARGTFQNMAVFGQHYSYLQPGRFCFRLTDKALSTNALKDGVYDLVVTATDTRGNTGTASVRFTVHNRPGWIGS